MYYNTGKQAHTHRHKHTHTHKGAPGRTWKGSWTLSWVLTSNEPRSQTTTITTGVRAYGALYQLRRATEVPSMCVCEGIIIEDWCLER